MLNEHLNAMLITEILAIEGQGSLVLDCCENAAWCTRAYYHVGCAGVSNHQSVLSVLLHVYTLTR